jgi:alkylhydroperoxidase family enzyme
MTTRFPTHTEQTAPAAAVPMLAEMQERFGVPLNLFGKMAESPALLDAYIAVSKVFDRSALSDLQRAVVLLTVSRYHECHYCMAAHSVGADMIKAPSDVTDALRNDEPIPDAQLEALRRFTHHLVDRRGWAEPGEVQALLDAGYSREQLLDVVVGVGLKTLSNYTNHITGTELDAALSHRAWSPAGSSASGNR